MFSRLPSYKNRFDIFASNSANLDFSRGQILFTLGFLVVFVIGLIWAYTRDKQIARVHFKGVAWKLILTIIGLYSLIFLLIKLLH
jgi:hypothetical protein